MASQETQPRFEDVTETTGMPISREAARMLYSRYRLAAELARDKRVLEIGCAAGQGLGLISGSARFTVGADYSRTLLRSARSHYRDRVPLVRLSAEALPFRNGIFDVVFFFEASYYVPDMGAGFDEITRILAPGGMVLFVNANPERPDFIRSPHSTHYHAADDFRAALEGRGLQTRVEGAFPVLQNRTLFARAQSALLVAIRLVLVRMRLIPRTLRGRARLKRLVYGSLQTVPPEIPADFAAVEPRVDVPPGRVEGVKVLYVSGVRRIGQ